MRTIISALHFPWRNIAECCATVRDALHLDGVELSLHESYARPHCTREDLEALPRVAGGLLLEAHLWEDLAQLGPDAGADALRTWLDVCHRAGITGVVLHGGSYPDRQAGLARVSETLARVLEDYARAGVAIHLENHYAFDYHDCHELFSEPWEFRQMFSHLPNPALNFCFDTGHGVMTHNWESLLRDLAPALRHIHLADNHGIDDNHLPYRHGVVPWDAMYAVLHEIKFDGTFCIEYPIDADRVAFRQCVEDLARYRSEVMHG